MSKLNGKQINALLRETFEQHTPNRAEQIIRIASGRNAAPTVSVTQKPSRAGYIRRAAAIAVAAALVFGIIFGAVSIYNSSAYATVTVESDVCVEISLNRAYKPIGLRPVGQSAAPLVQKIESRSTLEDSVDCILDGMLENGNLTANNNTVLITASAPENAEALLNTAFVAAKNSFAASRYHGAILTAVASKDAAVLRLAERCQISVGKATLVADIRRSETRWTAEQLCRLSVNELNLLTTYRSIRYEKVGIFGVSRGGVTPDDAIALAQGDAGAEDENARLTLDVNESGLVYYVSVRSGDRVYQYCMSAGSGNIIGVTEDVIEPASPESPTQPPIVAAPTKPQPVPPSIPSTDPPSSSATERITPTVPAPTQPAPTQPPTQPTPTEPAVFTNDSYLNVDSTPSAEQPGENARRVAITRIVNGYDVFFDRASFPYTAAGEQGGITALVCSREQFVRLTGSDDDRFDDSYFATRALYIHMNRDVDYHWIKSVQGAYMDNGTLFIESGEPVGYYITTDDENPERIYTVVWELNKAELRDLVNVKEYEG